MRFYRLTADIDDKYFHGEWEPYPVDLHGIYLGDDPPDSLHVRIAGGDKPGDMMLGSPNVVSPRLARLLEDMACSGYSTFRVPIVGAPCAVPDYYGLIVRGRGGEFDAERSDADVRDEGTIFGFSAVYMHDDDWDGSDLFFIPGLGVSLFVTERVADAIKDAKLEGVELILNSEFCTGTRLPLMRPEDFDFPD